MMPYNDRVGLYLAYKYCNTGLYITFEATMYIYICECETLNVINFDLYGIRRMFWSTLELRNLHKYIHNYLRIWKVIMNLTYFIAPIYCYM